MSADKIQMLLNVPTVVTYQSKVAKRMSEKSKGKVPLSELLHAKKEVDGLLPMAEDLFAPKPIKVSDAQLAPAERASAGVNAVKYGDVQTFIRERARAEKAVSAIRNVYTFTLEAEAEIEAEMRAVKVA